MPDTFNITIGGSTATSAQSDVATSSPTGGGITPQNSALLSQLMDGAFADNDFDANDLAAMNALLSAPASGFSPAVATAAPTPAEAEMTDADFLSTINDLANQTDGWGRGEDMMLEQANRLVAGGGSAADKQAFIDEATKLLNNDDGDHGKDIDEKNGKEGTMLKSLTTALLANNDEVAEPDMSDPNTVLSSFLSKAYADNKLSSTEVAGLQALLGVEVSGGTAPTSTTTTTASDTDESSRIAYSYSDLVNSMIMRGGINSTSIQHALDYANQDDE